MASSGHTNLEELVSLLRAEIPEGRQTLLDTQSNLEKVADYCASNYLNQSADKRAAFENTKNYTTHSLASVAYQVNTLAFNILHMLELQTNQISEMESQLNYITQKVDFHREKVARREVALLTSAKTSQRMPKVLAPANKEKQSRYIRKPIDYSLLDEIGHGVRTPAPMSAGVSAHPIYRTGSSVTSASNNTSGGGNGAGHRLSGIQTLGPKNSISGSLLQSSHYQQGHYNTLGGAGGGGHQPPPTSKPPTPPQAARGGIYGTLGRSGGGGGGGSKEYRALAPPPIAPPQVPKNYEPNYPMGHPKSSLTGQRSVTGGNQSYSTLPPGASSSNNHSSIYGGGAGGGGSQLYGYSGNGVNTSQYAPGMAQQQQHQQQQDPLPPPPPSLYDSRNSTASPPLPPPPPPVEEQQVHQNSNSNPNQIYGTRPNHMAVPDWVPPTYLEKVIAIYDYAADKDDELTFQENSVIYVIRKNDDGWFEGVMNGVTGLFPGNYVEACR